MRLQDFTPSKLVCLAASLRQRHRDYRNIGINIFSLHEAAQSEIYVQESNREDIEMLSHMHAQYSYDADKHQDYVEIMPTGAVTLAATITRSGKVDHVRVVKAESIPASAAIQNLSSWRLEPAPREETIQITYSYAIDNSLRRMDGMQVQWALPNAVSIRIPPE